MGVELFEPTSARLKKLVGNPFVDADIAVGANINANKIGTGVVDNTEFNRLNGITSALEEQGNKGAVSGYAGLGASQELLLANFPTGTGLQVLRRNTGNTALEFSTPGAASQTPWTQNIDADGFDLFDLSNILFRNSTGAPTATDRSIHYNDAEGMVFNALTGDFFQLEINAIQEYRFTSTQADFNTNNVVNMGTLNTHTIPGGTSTFAIFTDNLSVFAATTSLQLLGVISDETGSGLLVFGTSPTIVIPTIASFVNATHSHLNAAGGGTITVPAISGTKAQFDTALTDDDFAYIGQGNVFTQDQRIQRTGAIPALITDRNEIVADDTEIGRIVFSGFDDGSVGQTYARISVMMESDVAGAEHGSMRLRVTEASVVTTYINLNDASNGLIDFIKNTSYHDNVKALFGTGNDASILYDGINLIIKPDEVGVGVFTVNQDTFNCVLPTLAAANTFALLGTANIFTADQAISVSGSSPGLTWSRTDEHGTNIRIADLIFQGRNDTPATITYVDFLIDARGNTAGSETARFRYRVRNSGGLTVFLDFRGDLDRLDIGAGIDLFLATDNQKLLFGTGADASILYDGTNLVIDPKEVGSGVLSVLGDISILDEDIILGTTTGTKIGTATTQKIGFWNATPVVQQVHVADPTDLATCITAITAINAKDAATGLTAAA